MEMIPPKPASRLPGFGLLIFILLLYGDQVTFVQTDMEPEVRESWLSDQTRAIVTQQPAYFEMNMGQTHESVKYLSRGKHHTLFLTPERAVLSLTGTGDKEVLPFTGGRKRIPALASTELIFQLAGSNPVTEINGINKHLHFC